ncbi:hypothetical protein [Thermoflavimicrobium dichotomicum]|uniref:Uncharacterized protein n=1 Tax=Thermoflavimicrobium dichotomicum TaxID=46223 RepID=A0A1I3PYW5_9BACL|nr:hypothetical protein [Thermoflavimicrobium dichotomicum]SFJ26605.1 hypothetical protein SAMN05421852_106169 [Thermoflavimicrobium dichotomicum]
MKRKIRFGIIRAKDDPEMEEVSQVLKQVEGLVKNIGEQIQNVFHTPKQDEENQHKK